MQFRQALQISLCISLFSISSVNLAAEPINTESFQMQQHNEQYRIELQYWDEAQRTQQHFLFEGTHEQVSQQINQNPQLPPERRDALLTLLKQPDAEGFFGESWQRAFEQPFFQGGFLQNWLSPEPEVKVEPQVMPQQPSAPAF